LVDVPQEEQLVFSGTGRVKSLHHSCVEGGQDSKGPKGRSITVTHRAADK